MTSTNGTVSSRKNKRVGWGVCLNEKKELLFFNKCFHLGAYLNGGVNNFQIFVRSTQLHNVFRRKGSIIEISNYSLKRERKAHATETNYRPRGVLKTSR